MFQKFLTILFGSKYERDLKDLIPSSKQSIHLKFQLKQWTMKHFPLKH